MVVIRYAQVYLEIFEFLKRTCLQILVFFKEVQYVQYNDYAL